MRCAYLALPLALATLFACQPTDDPSASGDPVPPSAPAPSFGATALKIPFNFFFVFDPDRGYSATFGLVSPVSDAPECGGSQPVYDGGGTEQIVETPSGAFHLRDDLHQATIVLYEGATPDACELTAHPVLARGRGNLHWTVKALGNGSSTLQATFGGILELAAGGRVRMLGVGNVRFDELGNVIVHEDHFELKPIGK
jgi:hypothetical protein